MRECQAEVQRMELEFRSKKGEEKKQQDEQRKRMEKQNQKLY